jgi:hypothetical protein
MKINQLCVRHPSKFRQARQTMAQRIAAVAPTGAGSGTGEGV